MTDAGEAKVQQPEKRVLGVAHGPRWPERLRTFGWVGVVAALVWVWADMERPSETDNIEVLLKLSAADNAILANADPKTGGVLVRFTCRGPQSRLKGFVRDLSENRKSRVCVIQPDPSWKEEGKTYTLDTLKVLADWPALRDAGLRAESPSQTRITVGVDPWREPDVRVVLRTTDDAAVVGPVLRPSTVKIRLRESELLALGGDPKLPTMPLDLKELDVAGKHTMPVSFHQPPAINGQIVQLVGEPSVEASFGLQAIRTRSPKVLVELIAAPAIWKRVVEKGYIPRLGAEHVDLEIKGDPIEVDKYIEKVRAFVAITDSDFDSVGQMVNRPVTVFLPPGLALEGEAPGVDFALVKPTPSTP